MADNFYVRRNNGNEKTGAKTNWAWYFGIFILVLISVSFILPATGFSTGKGNSVYFGKFGKRKIEYGLYPAKSEYANIAEQYYDYYSSMFSSGGLDSQDWIRNMAYSSAFSEILNRYAKLTYAEKSKMAISDREASRYVVENFFKDSDGKFNSEYWKTISQDDKKAVIAEAKDSLTASHFDSDYSKIAKNDKNNQFIFDNLGEARNFNMIFFKGEDAKYLADNAISALNNGDSMENVKQEGQDVVKIENVYRDYSDGTFFPTRSSSGEMGQFLSKIGESKELCDALFSLDAKSAYSSPIEIEDGTWAVIEFDSNQTAEQSESVKGSIEGRIEYLDENDLETKIRTSKLFDDKFSEGYSKLFVGDSNE